jgi:hypothetical protein
MVPRPFLRGLTAPQNSTKTDLRFKPRRGDLKYDGKITGEFLMVILMGKIS